jgi:exopolysaccharide production protein ExoY
MLLIAAVIVVTDGRPVFFAHQRIGRNGKPFGCLKFRTMVRDSEAQLQRVLASDPAAREQWEKWQKLDSDPRITCVGHLLRKSGLDELPQFLNVLKGEMAVVGPRPIVYSEVHHYGDHFRYYLSVKPGITGAWQVDGREITSYDDRVEMDVDYVRSRTFVHDLLIIMKTVKVMVLRNGTG